MTTPPVPGHNGLLSDAKHIRAVSASLTVTCTACGKDIIVGKGDFTERAIPDHIGVVESGVTCPACGTFHFAAWDSDALKAMRAELDKARGDRWRAFLHKRYLRAFRKLQKEMRKDVSPPDDPSVH